MKRLKVLHILDVEKEAFYFSNLADFSDPQAVEFVFVTFAPEGDFSTAMRDRGYRVHALNTPRRVDYPRAGKKIWQILTDEKPDIVHTHLFDPTVIGLFLARLKGIPVVITRHHSDALHNIANPLKRRFYLALEEVNNYTADHLVAPARMVHEYLVEREQTPSEKVSLIPYGQRYERFAEITPEVIAAKRAELGMNEQLSLVCVSRLFDRKGHKYLFEAFAPLIKDGLKAKLYLVGTGPHRETLERMVAELGIDEHVEFLGWRKDGLAIIGAADIIVHPSLEDALSQSLIESLMLGKPIVATDISGAADTLDGGKYGALVPPADSKSFGVALAAVIDDLDGALERAAAGREYLLEYMDATRVATEYLKIYRRVASAIVTAEGN